MRHALILSLLLPALTVAQNQGIPPYVKNTQNPKDIPPTPERAVKLFHPMKGFKVTLFAGEPNVAQPIALTFDDRGRLWVAECFSFPKWKKTGGDRILIFEDTDKDGQFDKRTVFWDKAYNLTGLEIGYGGVWAVCAPHLLFIPDKNQDDKPDGKPQVVLDGWSLKSKHNIVSGITWGPDGWLWGRHGIVHESVVGVPGSAEKDRIRMLCGIWRYQPTRKKIEVVTHGTTNPWGLDFDEYGEAFHTNNVIGHLWHVVPGAHFKRMYGKDYNPNIYELIDSASDHIHWGGGKWTTSRGGKGKHDKPGGGHSHSGGMIYLGDNWPKEFRNNIFMCNIHGNRINRDILHRKGCGYVGKHGRDFLTSENPWFRGIDLDYGPTGAVYVTDWVDFGECHDNDGVHRRSGRIYRVTYGEVKSMPKFDLGKKSNLELAGLQGHRNDWFVRHARRRRAERFQAGQSMEKAHEHLRRVFRRDVHLPRVLRAMWALNVTGGASEKWLQEQLDHPDEHVRSWAVRLLCETKKPSEQTRSKFQKMAKDDRSGLVRHYLASMLQRMPIEQRFQSALALSQPADDKEDRCQRQMMWYALEPGVVAHRKESLSIAAKTKIPKLRQFIARRLAEGKGKKK